MTPETILIWGYGAEGQANYRHLREKYPKGKFTIINSDPHNLPAEAAALSEAEALPLIAKGAFDLIAKSPGVSLYKPEISEALQHKTRITSGTNLWFEKYPKARTVIVTGTKGKSTTSSILYHLLKGMGRDVVLAGNIGKPLLETEPAKDVTIIELSSYQLADLQHAPTVGILLNLYPEHRDWHLTEERYYQDKIRLKDLSPDTIMAFNQKSDALMKRVGERPHTIYFSGENITLPLSGIVRGDHNKLNIDAALSAITALGYECPDYAELLRDFKPLPHRQEEVANFGGVLYVDDSISTVPEATLAALNVYQDKNIILLLGGHDREQDYTNLADYISRRSNIHVLTMPNNGPRIAESLDARKIENIPTTGLEDALQKIKQIEKPDDVVLLSPAAPSYGHFRNFQERGKAFLDIAKALHN